jgi:hypothetical protein
MAYYNQVFLWILSELKEEQQKEFVKNVIQNGTGVENLF